MLWDGYNGLKVYEDTEDTIKIVLAFLPSIELQLNSVSD